MVKNNNYDKRPIGWLKIVFSLRTGKMKSICKYIGIFKVTAKAGLEKVKQGPKNMIFYDYYEFD